jgi:hypothetical protein
LTRMRIGATLSDVSHQLSHRFLGLCMHVNACTRSEGLVNQSRLRCEMPLNSMATGFSTATHSCVE